MSRKLNLKLAFQFAVIEAIVFCIPVYFYIHDATYAHTWLLFLGSFFFLVVTIIHTLRDSRRRGGYERTFTLAFDSHMITILGIIFSCILSVILLAVLVPGYFNHSAADITMTGEPPQNQSRGTNGPGLKIFMTAVIANFSVGSFVGIVLPFYTTRKRRGDSGEQFPLKQKGTDLMSR
jgi:hypothetical protein